MTEWRVKWCQCPHVQHSSKILFVEATTQDDAGAVAREYIERTYGIGWFTIQEVRQHLAPAPAMGKVILG